MGRRRWTRSVEPDLLTPVQFLALPAQPDGTVVRVLADAADGVIWTFRYRAASVSPYKWERIGGPHWLVVSASGIATVNPTSGGFQDLSANLDIVPPLTGDYESDFWASVSHNGTGYATVYYGPATVGGSPAEYIQIVVGNGMTLNMGMHISKHAVSWVGGATIRMRWGASGGAVSVLNTTQRVLGICPRRVAGP